MKRSKGRFNRIPSDQCIKQTINRQQKCRGGIIGFAAGWVLTSHLASKCYSVIEARLGIAERCNKPKDVGKTRSKFDNECVQRAYEVLAT